MPHSPTSHGRDLILPAAPSARFASVFAWYTRRLLRRSFAAVRATPACIDLLRTADAHPAPAIIAMNHTAWWDPIIALAVGRAHLPSRAVLGPMDRAQLEKFAFFRKAGVFGVDPDNPRSLDAMGDYLSQRFRENPRTALWITPQGRFTDVRSPIVIRPGVSALAARTPDVRAIAFAVEYGFWFEQKPEVFLHAEPVEPRGPSTTDWHRALTDAMTHAAASLADAVQSRDPDRFRNLLGERTGRVHPLYDLWLRIRGKSGSLRDARHAPAPRPEHTP